MSGHSIKGLTSNEIANLIRLLEDELRHRNEREYGHWVIDCTTIEGIHYAFDRRGIYAKARPEIKKISPLVETDYQLLSYRKCGYIDDLCPSFLQPSLDKPLSDWDNLIIIEDEDVSHRRLSSEEERQLDIELDTYMAKVHSVHASYY